MRQFPCSKQADKQGGKVSWALLLNGRGSLGKVGSISPELLPRVIGQVRYGRERKGITQVLEAEPRYSLLFFNGTQCLDYIFGM